MDIARKTDYALRILDLMAQRPAELLSVRAAADAVGVPYSFARVIQRGLMQADIIESLRGVRGGMRLKADPASVTLRQVVEAVNGSSLLFDDAAAAGGRPGVMCCYHPLWAGAQALLCSYFESVTLDDVLSRRRNPAVDPMFCDRARFDEYVAGAASQG